MKNLQLLPLRRAFALAAITGLTATSATAIAAPAKKSKVAKRGASADLVVRDLEVDILGETLAVTADLKNLGAKKAGRSTVLYAISSDDKLDASDDVLGDTQVRRVKPGQTRALDAEVDVPDDEDLPGGDVYLLVCADGYDGVRERDESNNCASELLASEDDELGDDIEIEDDPSGGDASDEGEELPVSEDA